jgi:hypothetical protein
MMSVDADWCERAVRALISLVRADADADADAVVDAIAWPPRASASVVVAVVVLART